MTRYVVKGPIQGYRPERFRWESLAPTREKCADRFGISLTEPWWREDAAREGYSIVRVEITEMAE